MRATAVRLALQRWGSDATSPLGVRLAAWDADPDGAEVRAVWLDVEARVSPTYYGHNIVLARAHYLAHLAMQLVTGGSGGQAPAGPVSGITHMRRSVQYAVPGGAAGVSFSDAQLMTTAPGIALLGLRNSRATRAPRVVWPH